MSGQLEEVLSAAITAKVGEFLEADEMGSGQFERALADAITTYVEARLQLFLAEEVIPRIP